jgi:DNA-binding MarR family transcriptional regulator
MAKDDPPSDDLAARNGAGERKRRARPPLDHGVLPRLIGYQLRRAQVAVFQNFSAHTADFGVTPGQVGVLVLIRENEGLSQSELGEALGIDRSTMVAVIDRLEGRRLVVRAPSRRDRRSYALKLSAAGRRFVDDILPAIAAHEAEIAEGLNAAEQATLLRLLAKLAAIKAV